MKRNFFFLTLSVLLTIAVTDFIWIQVFDDERTAIEIETEAESKIENSVKEKEALDLEFEFSRGNFVHTQNSNSFNNFSSGFLKHGNSFFSERKSNFPRLFILHCQMRLHC
jgi:hypothetical protein